MISGTSGVFAFPFRIYCEGDLPQVELPEPSRGYAYRVYAPFTVRPKGAPLTPFPHFDSWPAFEWSPRLSSSGRLKPPPQLHPTPFGTASYDALRVDVWGPDSAQELHTFIARLMAWLRHVSRQAWIGRYEAHTESYLKNAFRVDKGGRAVDTPYTNARFLTPAADATPMTSSKFKDAVRSAAEGIEPPLYWGLYFDAQVHFAQDDMRSCILAYATSLEVARDVIFPRFAATKTRPHLGEVLKPPFDSQDLLDHLSVALEKSTGRNLAKEHPTAWKDIKALYVARHHVAHGRPAIRPDGTSRRLVNQNDFKSWTKSVNRALTWIEQL